MLDLNQFYKKSIRLIYNKTQTKGFNTIYKENWPTAKTFNELRLKFPKNLHPLFVAEIKKQYENKKDIQSGLFTELSIFATLGKMYNISDFTWENSSYIYENDNWKFVLQGNAGHGKTKLTEGNDLLIIDKVAGKTYNCEIKEPIARFKERDIYYNEEGKLVQRKDLLGTPYEEIINYFNDNFNVFDTIGHNTPIPEKYIEEVIKDYYKDVDYIFTYIRGILAVIPKVQSLIDQIYNKTVGEIRTLNGKNPRTIFTKKYSQKILDKYLIKEDEDNYYFHKNHFELRNGKNTNQPSRYALVEGFFIPIKDAHIDGEILWCKKKNYKQNCPLISPKAALIPTYLELKKLIIKGGYNIDK